MPDTSSRADRELLELAAKAADLAGAFWSILDDGICVPTGEEHEGSPTHTWWNPLTDDGDALRLAVKLHLEIDHNHPLDQSDLWAMARVNGEMNGRTEEIGDESQRLAATRRAIVRAAAAIGANRE